MAISCADAATHLDEINEEEGDDLEENPTEDKVVPKTNFTHYQFLENEEENDNKELEVLQQNYDTLLKMSGKYAGTAENAIRRTKMEIYMCKVEEMKVELESAYSEIRFLEYEVIKAKAKMDRISNKKLDTMLEA